MTDAEYNATFKLPFNEASAFFKQKLNIPTERWDDLWKEEHAKGFMSAGAMKADLLSDLHASVQKAIDGGLSLKDFRSQFDDIVTKHGWDYKGGRNWRSTLIYDTNITTAYQAGRWQQFQDAGTKYLKYIHADGVRHPRPLHVAWNGTVRPIDDPFWGSHYPPNGWCCHCRAVAAEAGEVTAEPAGWKDIDPKTGTMQGIDKGWDYNVGKAWRGQLPDTKGDVWSPLPYPQQEKGKILPLDHVLKTLGPAIHNKQGMIEAVRNTIGADEAFIRFEKGDIRQDVYLNAEQLGSHLALDRSPYIPFLIDVIENPAEIRLLFEQNQQTGRVRLSVNFIKGIDTGNGKAMFLVSRVRNGIPEGLTLIPAKAKKIDSFRKGKLLYES
jgi:SPP1 gp7 family putative phage head morphogenesis protein